MKVHAEFLKQLAEMNLLLIILDLSWTCYGTKNSDGFENVSDDTESLFSSVPMKETIDYIVPKHL